MFVGRMRPRGLIALVAALICQAPSAVAGGDAQVNAPDPSMIVLPNLVFQPTQRDVSHYDEYFYFYKENVSYSRALADLEDCNSYSRVLSPMHREPEFVPLGGEANPPTTQISAGFALMYGPIGLGIAAIAMDDIQAAMERANLRRCMGFKGYQRYGTSRFIARSIFGRG